MLHVQEVKAKQNGNIRAEGGGGGGSERRAVFAQPGTKWTKNQTVPMDESVKAKGVGST